MAGMTATWTDPTGAVWPLTDTDPNVGMFTPGGPAGWMGIKYEIVTDPLPRGGESLRFIRAQAGRLTWPLHINGDNASGEVSSIRFQDRWRAIRRAFTMTLHRSTPGVLRVTWADGTVREIDCYYEEGFGGAGGENHIYANPVLTLYCPDGYWRDPVQIVESRSFQVGASFLAPFPTVSQGQVLGSSTIDNPGDVDAWPTWTITGPADVVTATNLTTGHSFMVSKSISAGQLIIITTDRPTVRGPLAENLISTLNLPDAYLWPLQPGLNSVDFAVAGAGTGTAIQLAFNARYEGA